MKREPIATWLWTLLLTLVLMGGKTPSFDEGGGVDSTNTILFVKTIENVIRLRTAIEFFLRSSFKDMGFFAIDR